MDDLNLAAWVRDMYLWLSSQLPLPASDFVFTLKIYKALYFQSIHFNHIATTIDNPGSKIRRWRLVSSHRCGSEKTCLCQWYHPTAELSVTSRSLTDVRDSRQVPWMDRWRRRECPQSSRTSSEPGRRIWGKSFLVKTDFVCDTCWYHYAKSEEDLSVHKTQKHSSDRFVVRVSSLSHFFLFFCLDTTTGHLKHWETSRRVCSLEPTGAHRWRVLCFHGRLRPQATSVAQLASLATGSASELNPFDSSQLSPCLSKAHSRTISEKQASASFAQSRLSSPKAWEEVIGFLNRGQHSLILSRKEPRLGSRKERNIQVHLFLSEYNLRYRCKYHGWRGQSAAPCWRIAQVNLRRKNKRQQICDCLSTFECATQVEKPQLTAKLRERFKSKTRLRRPDEA